MNKDDRAELREILDDVMQGHINEITGRFNVQHIKLVEIKEQTTKTNGRVTELEKEQAKIKTELSNKRYNLKSIATMSLVVSALVGAVVAFIELIIK